MFDRLARLGSGDRVFLAEMVEALGRSAHGILMLAFAIPCCLPMPPGIGTTCGIAILILSIQILVAKESLYLPRFLLRRTMQRADLVRLTNKVRPVLRWIERFSRPRAALLVGSYGFVVIGILGIVCGIALILPIPFLGNLLPGYAAAALSIGLIQRDGVAVLVGIFLSALVVGMLTVLWLGVANGINVVIQSRFLIH